MTDIHPTAVICGEVDLGEGVTIGAYAVLSGPLTVGDRTWIGPHAVVGGLPQGQKFDRTTAERIIIGADCVVREFVSINHGSVDPTSIGDRCYVMAYAHVPHDAVIEDDCTISNRVQLGGHVWVGRGANLGLGAVVHQFVTLGDGAMVGMAAAVHRDVPPFAVVLGAPARVVAVNRVGLERLGHDLDSVAAVESFLSRRRPIEDLPQDLQLVFERFEQARDRQRGAVVTTDER